MDPLPKKKFPFISVTDINLFVNLFDFSFLYSNYCFFFFPQITVYILILNCLGSKVKTKNNNKNKNVEIWMSW